MSRHRQLQPRFRISFIHHPLTHDRSDDGAVSHGMKHHLSLYIWVRQVEEAFVPELLRQPWVINEVHGIVETMIQPTIILFGMPTMCCTREKWSIVKCIAFYRWMMYMIRTTHFPFNEPLPLKGFFPVMLPHHWDMPWHVPWKRTCVLHIDRLYRIRTEIQTRRTAAMVSVQDVTLCTWVTM